MGIPLTPNHKLKQATKSLSTSDFKPSSSSSPLGSFKNDTAGLAATKLKLKLQLALYKLQQKNKSEPEKKVPTPLNLVSVDVRSFQLPAPSNVNYQSSVNVNLRTKTRSSNTKSSKPSLTKIASNKHNNHKISKLKLFKIRNNSLFYQPPKELAITFDRVDRNHSAGSRSRVTNDIKLPRPTVDNSFKRTTLPSINKILKTPIKHSNSTRSLICNHNADDTIDEDDTIINTANNKLKKYNNLLTSSPITNNFGTPNSFSVAKSLLQLGGYCMS